MQWRASSVFAAVDFPAPELPTRSALWLLRVQTERYAVAPVRRLVPTIGWPASLNGVPSTGSRRAATASVVSWRRRRGERREQSGNGGADDREPTAVEQGAHALAALLARGARSRPQ